jgi:hypothetical protein
MHRCVRLKILNMSPRCAPSPGFLPQRSDEHFPLGVCLAEPSSGSVFSLPTVPTSLEEAVFLAHVSPSNEKRRLAPHRRKFFRVARTVKRKAPPPPPSCRSPRDGLPARAVLQGPSEARICLLGVSAAMAVMLVLPAEDYSLVCVCVWV